VALGNWGVPAPVPGVLRGAAQAPRSGRNAIWQPLYSLAYFFIILLGFAALLARHQAGRRATRTARLLQFVSDKYPAWVVGLVAGTGLSCWHWPGRHPGC